MGMKAWMSRHKIWTGVLITVAALMVIGALSGTNDTTTSSGTTYYDPSTAASSDSSSDYSAPSESSGQENARESAESYLSTQAFSRSGLIHQLKYEGYSTADATYAVDAITVDWNEQAALSARSYLDTQSFSRAGLQHQLEYEGFTPAQAAYGVSVAY
jgi:hypothetical protein